MYSRQTRFFRLPVMANGNTLTQQSEANQMGIIDSLLQFATYGVANCIVEQGKYQFIPTGENLCHMELLPINGISLLGLLNKRLLYSETQLTSPEFTMDGTNYIYVQYEGETDNLISNSDQTIVTNETRFSIFVSKNEMSEENIRLLLCTVDFLDSNSGVPVILGEKIAWVNEDNKIYAKNLLAHANDSTNPHGKILYQDEVLFRHLNTNFLIEDNRLNFPVYGAIYQDVMSQGADQITVISLPSGLKPVFVTVTPTDPQIGNITAKYGQDLPQTGVTIPDTDYILLEGDNAGEKIWIENDGVAGKKIHVKIEVEPKVQFHPADDKEVSL